MKKVTLSVMLFCTAFISANLQATAYEEKNQFDNILFFYTVTINNKPYKFLLQSGYSESIIDKSLAEKLGGTLSKKDYPARLKNVFNNFPNQEAPSFIKAPEMKIGDNNIYLDILQIQDLSEMDKNLGFRIDGVLGTNVMNQYIWEFDNINKKSRVYPFSNTQIEKTYSSCIFYYSNEGIAPGVSVRKHTEDIPFLLSFGINVSGLDKSYINFLNLKEKNVPGGTEEYRKYYMDDFNFAGQTVKQDTFLATDTNYLGTQFLSRFDKILLNPVNQTFCFNHFNTEAAAPTYRSMSFIVNQGNIEIADDNDESFLKKSGLQKGDIVVSINNVNYPPEQVMLASKTAAYSKILNLEIKRDGKIVPVTLSD